jgi:hypothetical protein
MIIKNIVSLVKENPPARPKKKKSKRGRKPVHSWEKLVCISILMVVFGSTYRDVQNTAPSLNLPWNNEPYPDHTWGYHVHLRKYHCSSRGESSECSLCTQVGSIILHV